MKKVLSLILALMMLVVLSACSKSGKKAESSSEIKSDLPSVYSVTSSQEEEKNDFIKVEIESGFSIMLDVTNLYNVSFATLQNDMAKQNYSDLYLYDQTFNNSVSLIISRAIENQLVSKTGTLTIRVGGDDEVFERIKREITDCLEIINYTFEYSLKAAYERI